MKLKPQKRKIYMRDTKRKVTLVWLGGHGIHAYRNGKEFAFWNVGDFSKDHADIDTVKKSMKKMIKKGNYEDYS